MLRLRHPHSVPLFFSQTCTPGEHRSYGQSYGRAKRPRTPRPCCQHAAGRRGRQLPTRSACRGIMPRSGADLRSLTKNACERASRRNRRLSNERTCCIRYRPRPTLVMRVCQLVNRPTHNCCTDTMRLASSAHTIQRMYTPYTTHTRHVCVRVLHMVR